MPLISWSDRLSVGIERIDTEHQKLVGLINDLHAAMIKGQGRDVTGPILAGLHDYTVTHFRGEEQVLEREKYPDLEAHRAEHRALTAQVEEFRRRFEAGEIALTVALLMFLRDWLTRHIEHSDQAYGRFLVERGYR